MTRIIDRRLLTAAGAALLGVGGAALSAVAAGADQTGCPTPTDTQTAPDPTTTTPDPSTCTSATTTTAAPTPPTTTTTTQVPPPATTPAGAPSPQPAPPPVATPTPQGATSTPTAPHQRRHHTTSHHMLRTTTTHRHTAVHHAAKRSAHHHHRRGDAADAGMGRGRTLYLPSHMPDPTPPSARVDAGFMRMLRASAHHAGVDWALLLAVLRAKGHEEARPAKAATVRALADDLVAHGADLARAAAATTGSSDQRDRAVALARYYRGVGPHALVDGLNAAKPLLIDRVLSRPGIDIYPGGQVDVLSGRVNVRVLATILYLRQTFHQVTVSCLITGHRLYARPGVVSAHIYGLAADISVLGGVPIAGHQQAGGVTDRAVQDLLRLPILPKQIISLLDLGGPSFALSNHWDHIHVGY